MSAPICTRHEARLWLSTIETLIRVGMNADELRAEASELSTSIHPAFNPEYIVLVTDASLENSRRQYKQVEKDQMKCAAAKDEQGEAAAAKMLSSLRSEIELGEKHDGEGILSAIRPGLQLASAILRDQEQLPFWHGLMVAGQAHDCSTNATREPHTFSAKVQLTNQEIEETSEFLNRLGTGILIGFGDIGESLAVTKSLPSDAMVAGRSPGHYNDVLAEWIAYPRMPTDKRILTSRIVLNKEIVLRPCLNWRSMTIANAQKVWFRLAFVLLHELAHAATYLAFRDGVSAKCGTFEPYFGGEPAAEVGFAYENYAFGGLIDIEAVKDDLRICIRSWPCRETCQIYSDGPEVKDGKTIATRGEVPEETVAARVPRDDIARFFTTAFWSARAVQRGPGGGSLELAACCHVHFVDNGLLAPSHGRQVRSVAR